jgi:nitronate monooxygenase
MPLIPRVVDAVDVPVIAAGGIADGRGIAATLTLGADGVWLGTRFLATKEAHIHEQYREQVLGAGETETYFGKLFEEGWPDVPHRVLRNSTVEQWDEAGRPPRGDRPNEGKVATKDDDTPVERYADSLALPDMEGDIEALPLYAGQSTGLVGTAPAASEVVETLVEETHAALTRTDVKLL